MKFYVNNVSEHIYFDLFTLIRSTNVESSHITYYFSLLSASFFDFKITFLSFLYIFFLCHRKTAYLYFVFTILKKKDCKKDMMVNHCLLRTFIKLQRNSQAIKMRNNPQMTILSHSRYCCCVGETFSKAEQKH